MPAGTTPKKSIRRGLMYLCARVVVLGLVLALGVQPSAAAKAGGKGEPKSIRPIFYPPQPSETRLQFLTTISDSRLAMPPKGKFSSFVFGKDDRKPILINKPYGVAIHDGRLYVCDIRAGLLCLDLKNRSTSIVGREEPGKLAKPVNLFVHADGTLYVADIQRRQILVYAADHTFQAAFGKPGEFKPADVLRRGDRLYVADMEANQILILDARTGEIRKRIGKGGAKSGELFFPANITTDADGNLYVSETGNFRISIFTPDGKFIKSIGQLGTAVGSFARNKGLALDRDRNLYVTDAAFENIQVFNEKGKLLLFFLGPGSGPGDINLPADIWIDYDNLDYFRVFADPSFELKYLLFVSSQFGVNKINVYGFGTLKR
jgi:DNA-binding beta-propeller fold protein YncE